MICGVGCDLAEIVRFERLCAEPRFMEKCFTEREREYILSKKKPPESAAACFAAKEAAVKALGVGFSNISLCEIELLHRENGAPYVRLSGNALAAADGARLHISLSHTDGTAAAFCVAEK